MEQELTGYGLGILTKQMVAAGNYSAIPFDLESTMTLLQPDLATPSQAVDPDLLDQPRVRTMEDLKSALPTTQDKDIICYQVKILHTVTNKPLNPHFVVMHGKLEGREVYLKHFCTCGSGVTCGVPCRHFFAVLRSTTAACFHQGMINDLWFKVPQPLSAKAVHLHTYDDPQQPTVDMQYQRPVYTSTLTSPNYIATAEDQQVAKRLTHKRLWGALLGEAKKTIERAIELNAEDGLFSTLQGFGRTLDGANSADSGGVLNPEVVRGKGRPKGTTRLGITSGMRPPPRPRHPLQPLASNRQVHTLGEQRHQDNGPDNGPGATQEPAIASGMGEPPAKRMKRKCRMCNQEGHDVRTCPKKASAASVEGA